MSNRDRLAIGKDVVVVVVVAVVYDTGDEDDKEVGEMRLSLPSIIATGAFDDAVPLPAT